MNQSAQDPARLWLLISGRVQGVGFRFATVAEARSLGLNGWVRNTPEGDVEVVAEGTAALLQRLRQWCHRGPPGALVTQVRADWRPATGEFAGFRTRW